MYLRGTLIALFLLVPTLASAAAFGFPRQPLWVSSTSAREGENITVYAAVYNASESEMKGAVTFLADGAVFDTKAVTLPVGGSSLVSAAWPAVQGTHALSAAFESGTQKDATDKITVTISAAPPPPPPAPSIVGQTVGQATTIVQQYITPSSSIGQVAGAVIEKVEDVREAGADFFEPIAKGGSATSAIKNEVPKSAVSYISSAVKSDASILDKGLQIAAAAALFAFDTRWLFYVLIIVLLYLVLRTVKRWVNRPRF